MTPEEKVALLKKAGVWDVIGFPSCIDKLFDLVAAHEREKCFDAAMKAAEKAVDTAMLLEREACAKVCEENGKEPDDHKAYEGYDEGYQDGSNNCAAAIRARGE